MMSESVLEPTVRNQVSKPVPQRDNDEPPFSQSAMQVLTSLAREKRSILWVTGIAAVIGVGIALLLPIRFTAETRIMTPMRSQSTAAILMSQLSASVASPLMSAAGASLGLHSPNDEYIGLLQSRPIADAIIREFGLMKLYGSKDMTGARKKLAENTRILSDKSGMLAVSVTDKDKNRAAEMANAYIVQLRVLTKKLAVTEAGQRRLFYEDQLKGAKEDLVNAEYAFEQVQQQKGIIQPGAQTIAVVTNLANVHAQIAAKQAEIQVMRSFSAGDNPDLQRAETQLAALQNEARRLEQNSNASGISNFGLKGVPSATLDYLRAQHELQYRQTLYDLLLRQYEAAKMDEARDGEVIQIVENAIPPDRKSSPSRTLMVLWFAMIGFLGACVYVIAKERVRQNPELLASFSEFKQAIGMGGKGGRGYEAVVESKSN